MEGKYLEEAEGKMEGKQAGVGLFLFRQGLGLKQTGLLHRVIKRASLDQGAIFSL